MELEKFVNESLIGIQKGTQNAKTDESEAGKPLSSGGVHGVEFDLGVVIHDDKINVSGYITSGNTPSRIKFFVPIISKR